MEDTYEHPYKYLWRKYMQDYLHDIKDANDLRNHLNKTRNFPFARNLPSDEVLIWKPNGKNPHLSKYDEFYKGMIKQCPELMSKLKIDSYENFPKKLVCLNQQFL